MCYCPSCTRGTIVTITVTSVLVGLAIILIPTMTTVSVSYVERNMYAFRKNLVTNQVDETVYSSGRYFWGSTYSPIQFDGEYIRIHYPASELSVFSSNGLEFGIGINIYYRLLPSNLRLIFNQFGTAYNVTFINIIKAAIKNIAPIFAADQYVSNRTLVSDTFLGAVNTALVAVGINVAADRFMMMGVSFPSSVSDRYLNTAVQLLTNEEVILRRNVDLIESETDRQVAQIEANITITNSQATAESNQIIQNAIELGKRQFNEAKGVGLANLVTQLNITSPSAYQELLNVMTILDSTPKNVIIGSGSSQLLVSV